MQGSKKNLPVKFESEGVKIQEADWGDVHVSMESYDTEFNNGPLLQGLPDNRCQSQHWGYVLKGALNVSYQDGSSERIAAGSAYYIPPGHVTVIEQGTEFIEFSPVDIFVEMNWGISRNTQKIAAGHKSVAR